MRRAEDYAKMRGDNAPKPRGIGDRNRGEREVPQQVLKAFQFPEEITNNPTTNITGAIYNSGRTVPFNIDESGKPGGSHY